MAEDKKDGDKLSPVERRVAIWTSVIKRHGFTGLLIAVAPFVYPHIEKWWSNKQRDAILKPMNARFDQLNRDILYNRVLASTNHTKTLVNADDFNLLIRHRIRSQSLDKIKEIMAVVQYADKTTEKGRSVLWIKVKNILNRNTYIYINELNAYTHPVAGDIGLYISKTFPMFKNPSREYRPDYSFLGYIYKLVVEDVDSTNIEIESNLREYMVSIQSEYFSDMYKRLKKLESDINGI